MENDWLEGAREKNILEIEDLIKRYKEKIQKISSLENFQKFYKIGNWEIKRRGFFRFFS